MSRGQLRWYDYIVFAFLGAVIVVVLALFVYCLVQLTLELS